MSTFVIMKQAKQYISFFVFLVYTIGVTHTFIKHSDYDIQCSKEQKDCCAHDSEHQYHQYNYEDHSDLDLYDFIACLLGHINHSELVDNKITSAEKVILKAPKEIRELIAFCIVISQPLIEKEISYPIAYDLSQKSLHPLILSAKRGPPTIIIS